MRFPCLWIAFGACTASADALVPDDTSGIPIGDCEAAITMSERIVTTGTVSWTTDEPGRSWVEFGPTLSMGSTTAQGSTENLAHSVILAGIPTHESWFWQAVTELPNGDTLRCTAHLQTMGPRPRGMPSMDVSSGPSSSVHSGYRALTSQIGGSFTVIVNDQGQDVWWHVEEADTVVQRVLVSADGLTVTRMTSNNDFAIDESMILRSRIDGEPLSETRIEMGHHDFVMLPDDPTYAYAYIAAVVHEDAYVEEDIAYDVVGDAIVEISEDGNQSRVVWSSWESSLLLDVNPATDEGFYPQGLDWTHANSLQYVPESDSYVVSFRNQDAILNLSRADGSLLWQFGGDGGQFEMLPGRVPLAQHSADLLDPTHLLMFDNGAHDSYSRAVEFELDFAAGTATEVWSCDANQTITAFLLGDVEELANGNRAIAWGNATVYTEADDTCEVAMRIDADLGLSFGYVKQIDVIGGTL